MLTLETSILIAIIIASAIYVWRKSSSAKTAPILLDKSDKLIISLLSIAYALFSFIHLGSFQQFKTTWSGQEIGNQLNIQLTSPSKIGHIYYYSGINNAKYHWSDLNNANQEELINDPTANLGYPAHFKWNKIDLPVSDALIQQINLTIDQAPLEIKQLAIFDTNNNYISNLKIKANNSTENLSGLISSSAPQDYENSFSSSTVFDEIFYATTAYQLLHGLDPYVAVHPPLGMLLIALGIAIFGMSAFGWRIIPDICSILLVPLIYIFAKRLFKTRRAAIISTILIMSECMHYTLGRLAFLDGIVTLFIILEYYYLYSYLELRSNGAKLSECYRSLWLAGLTFGLGISCKWSALYSAIPIIVILLYGEIVLARPNLRQFLHSLVINLVFFVVLPISVYSLSYLPFIHSQPNENELYKFIWRMLQYMYEFQAYGLQNATHPYASSWLDWPLLKTPMSIFYWQSSNVPNLAASAVLTGNPLIYWLSLPMLAMLTIQAFRQLKDYRAWFLLLVILAQYLPYAFIKHIMFIYYFYSSVPLIILGLVYLSETMLDWNQRWVRYCVYGYLLAVILSFIAFLPAIGGFEFSRDYVVHYLFWRSGWNF